MPDSISEQDFINWWRDPVGRWMKKMIEGQVADFNAIGLTENMVRDPIKAAMYLGHKTALESLLEISYFALDEFKKELEGEG